MPAKLDVDDRAFQQALNKFETVSRKNRWVVLKEEAKLVVRNLMAITPPSRNASFTLSEKGKVDWKSQKKMGQGALLNDTLGKSGANGGRQGGVFMVRGAKTFRRAEQLNKQMGGDWGGMKHALWRTKTGKVLGVEKKLYNPDATIATMSRHHKKYRNARGRVSKGGQRDLTIGRHVFIDKMVVSKKAWKSYFSYLTKRLGRAKAGWLRAAYSLNFKDAPKWVANHGQREGRVKMQGGKRLYQFIELANRVPYIKRQNNEMQMVNRALRMQASNLLKKTKLAQEAAAKKAGFKRR